MNTIIDFSQYKNRPLVYHYASERYHLPKIIESGYLRPGAAGCEPHELPLLWFSKNQRWEPTATGQDPTKSPEAALKAATEYLGCVRFSLPADDPRLMDWREACKFAGTSTKIRRALEALGRRCGAKPSDWLAIACNVPLDEVRLQRFDGAHWRNMAASEVPAKTLFDYRVRITSKERAGGREFIICAEDFDKAHDVAYKKACEFALALNINVQLEITEDVS